MQESKKFSEIPPIPDCCREVGRKYFGTQGGLTEFFTGSHPFQDHLLRTCAQWGPITRALPEQFQLFATSSHQFVGAKVQNLRCEEGHVTTAIVVSCRLFYLFWRINVICSSYFDGSETINAGQIAMKRRSTDPWPTQREIDQIAIAVDTYLGDDLLSDVGFNELHEIDQSIPQIWVMPREWTSDLGLMFILLHELQHCLPPPPEDIFNFSVAIGDGVYISKQRKESWIEELEADANALFFLLGSVTMELEQSSSLIGDELKAQAGALAMAGADAALHAQELIETVRFGKLSMSEAAGDPKFVYHPPASTRRDILSHAAYTMLTRRPITDLWQGIKPNVWEFAAANVLSQMQLRNMLIDAYFGQGQG